MSDKDRHDLEILEKRLEDQRVELTHITSELRDRLAKMEGRIAGYSSAAAIISIVVAIALKFIQ